MVLTFELPLSGRLPTDASSPTIQHIAQTCNVTITFKQVSELIVAQLSFIVNEHIESSISMKTLNQVKKKTIDLAA